MNLERVRDLLLERSVLVPFSGCRLWEWGSNRTGYGFVRMNKRAHLTHRLAFEAFVGPIPDGLHVLHRCDVRCCINPDHLFLGTNKENIADSVSKGRRTGITRNRPSGLKYSPMSLAGRIAHMKLKPDAHPVIRAKRNQGVTLACLAAEYQVSEATIARVCR